MGHGPFKTGLQERWTSMHTWSSICVNDRQACTHEAPLTWVEGTCTRTQNIIYANGALHASAFCSTSVELRTLGQAPSIRASGPSRVSASVCCSHDGALHTSASTLRSRTKLHSHEWMAYAPATPTNGAEVHLFAYHSYAYPTARPGCQARKVGDCCSSG